MSFFRNHYSWEMTTKLTYDKDMSIKLHVIDSPPTFEDGNRLTKTALKRAVKDHLTSITYANLKDLSDNEKLIIRYGYGNGIWIGYSEEFHGADPTKNVNQIKLYFDCDDSDTVDMVYRYIKSHSYLAIASVNSPISEKHQIALRTLKTNQILREDLYWGKFRYSVYVCTPRTSVKTETYLEWTKRRGEILDRIMTQGDRWNFEFNGIRLFTNNIDMIAMEILGGEITRTEIKEVVLLGELDD